MQKTSEFRCLVPVCCSSCPSAKFAPNSGGPVPDKYTNSPRLTPADAIQAPQRTSTVSERIAQRVRDIQNNSTSTFVNASAEYTTEDPTPKADKGKAKAVEVGEVASPMPLSPESPTKVPSGLPEPTAPEPIVLGGIPFTPAAVSQLLTRAASELPFRPVRFPLLGEYQDSFTGEEFVTWLQESVREFSGNIDLAEDAAEVLTEQEGLLRRLGEFGNQFQGSDDAFYQFRPKVGCVLFDVYYLSTLFRPLTWMVRKAWAIGPHPPSRVCRQTTS